MANVLSLAMKISADATGVRQSLTPVERALDALAKNAEDVTKQFTDFAGTSEAAARAQADTSKAIEDLTASLKRGEIDARTFATEFAKVGEAADKQVASLRRAAQITEANITPQQRYERATAELREQFNAGRISLETFNRAMEKSQRDLEGTGRAAKTADTQLDGMAKNLNTISRIQIGRAIIGGFQALSSVFTRVAGEVASLAATVNANIDTLNDFSARTGIGVESLQAYSLAAKLAGVDAEAFGVAIQKLGVNIGKANAGDAFDKTLRGIGLSVAELKALAPEQQFSAIGDAISQLPTAADRAAAAVQLFGKQGAALAPLFREGAASIEELQARAERLGVIVSETQVNNVADMNDAFDLVRATVEGITGQVIGNLAPAVTAVTDQFLKFVEEWSGAQGEGGTGIANAITDVLLQGADYFAGIFDSFMQNFGDISTTLADVGEVFRIGGQLLVAGMEGFRAVFNVIQLGIDALLIGFGKILEAIGSYVSDDLEQFGAGLAAASQENADRNTAELEAAAANAAKALSDAFTGGDAEAAGQGEGQKFIKGLREQIENARLPEVKLQADLATTTADLDQFLKTATDGTSEFLQQSQGTLSTFSQMAAEGELTADQIKIMNGFMERLNQELVKEKQLRQEATEAAEKQAEADGKRVDELLKTSDAASKIEQDLAALERERQRINEAGGEAAQQRAAEIDQRRLQLEEQLQAIDQGFGDGFEKSFANTSDLIGAAQEKAKEFGQAGFDATLQLQEGIKAAQAQVKDGILNKEGYEVELKRQQELFDKRIEGEKKVIDDRNKAQAEANKLREQQEKTVNDLITQQEFGGDNARVKAAENLQAVEAEIARAQEDQRKARQENDKEAAAAAAKRLAQLDQVQAKERDIASGAAAQREEFQKKQAQLVEAQAKQQQQVFEEQKKFAEEQAKSQQAEFERQQKRLTELNTLGSQTVETADVRTAAGQQIVLDLFNQQQDPALIQARLTNKVLNRIAASIDRDLNRLGQPATIFP
jgi:hypothetical protein